LPSRYIAPRNNGALSAPSSPCNSRENATYYSDTTAQDKQNGYCIEYHRLNFHQHLHRHRYTSPFRSQEQCAVANQVISIRKLGKLGGPYEPPILLSGLLLKGLAHFLRDRTDQCRDDYERDNAVENCFVNLLEYSVDLHEHRYTSLFTMEMYKDLAINSCKINVT